MTGDFWADFNGVYGRWGKSYVDVLLSHKSAYVGSKDVEKGKVFLLEDDDGNTCLGKVVKVDSFGIVKFRLDIETFDRPR